MAARARIKGVVITLPRKDPGPAPRKPLLTGPRRRWLRRSLEHTAVAVYMAALFVVLLAWRIARPFVKMCLGFFMLCLMVELFMRFG